MQILLKRSMKQNLHVMVDAAVNKKVAEVPVDGASMNSESKTSKVSVLF